MFQTTHSNLKEWIFKQWSEEKVEVWFLKQTNKQENQPELLPSRKLSYSKFYYLLLYYLINYHLQRPQTVPQAVNEIERLRGIEMNVRAVWVSELSKTSKNTRYSICANDKIDKTWLVKNYQLIKILSYSDLYGIQRSLDCPRHYSIWSLTCMNYIMPYSHLKLSIAYCKSVGRCLCLCTLQLTRNVDMGKHCLFILKCKFT